MFVLRMIKHGIYKKSKSLISLTVIFPSEKGLNQSTSNFNKIDNEIYFKLAKELGNDGKSFQAQRLNFLKNKLQREQVVAKGFYYATH